nr:olfactory receptor 44 [Gregopimpla kuwanae]
MNFRSINKFNVVVNALSGNFLPLSEEKTSANFACTIYVIFTWVLKFIFLSSMSIGLLCYVPAFEALQRGAVTTIVAVETLSLSAYWNFHRENLQNLIGKMNKILVDSEDLKRCIHETIGPHKKRLKIYTIATVITVFFWALLPVMKISESSQFTYVDFVLPSYLPGAPFSTNFFIFWIIIEAFGGTYLIFKKIGMDVYVNYVITLLTAQYRYVHEIIYNALRRDDCGEDEGKSLVIDSLRKCVRYQCEVMEIGQMVRKLLAVNVALTYLSCVLRFCFLAFFIITIPGNYFEKCFYLSYTIGILIQVYMFCSCCQGLLDASTSITDDAFHEDWYGRGKTVKRIFQTIGLSNRMECRLSAFRVVDLTVPTFVAILNQAYSACLLLLRVQ